MVDHRPHSAPDEITYVPQAPSLGAAPLYYSSCCGCWGFVTPSPTSTCCCLALPWGQGEAAETSGPRDLTAGWLRGIKGPLQYTVGMPAQDIRVQPQCTVLRDADLMWQWGSPPHNAAWKVSSMAWSLGPEAPSYSEGRKAGTYHPIPW